MEGAKQLCQLYVQNVVRKGIKWGKQPIMNVKRDKPQPEDRTFAPGHHHSQMILIDPGAA